MPETYDWSRFTVRIDIKALPASIYEAWTSQEMLELWFLRLAVFTTPEGAVRSRFEQVTTGDRYTWRWYGYGDDVAEKGEILEANGSDLLRFTFGTAGDCTVKVYEESGESMVALTQENIPADEQGRHRFHLGCMNGWTFYLANLKSLLEGGIDLRNRNAALRGMINS